MATLTKEKKVETLVLDKSKIEDDIATLKQQVQARAQEVANADPTFCALNAQLITLQKLECYKPEEKADE